jgi:lipopolysaccharide export system permease protein
MRCARLPRILRIYVLREVTLPTAMALLTITFVLLVASVFNLINLLLQPAVTFGQMLGVLARLIPQLLVIAMPAAILVGTLVGVGRMTLDREILATRASGISLLSVFAPTVGVALAISLGIMGLSAGVIPHYLLDGLRRAAELQFAVINSLEPGRFHELPPGGDPDFILYFRDRDPVTRGMRGIVIKLENDFQLTNPVPAIGDSDRDGQRRSPAVEPSGAASDAASTDSAPLNQAADRGPGDAAAAGEAAQAVIFAESGTILSNLTGEDEGGTGNLVIELSKGSMHRLSGEGDNQQYFTFYFPRFKKVFVFSSLLESLSKDLQTRSNRELRAIRMESDTRPARAYLALSELVRRFTLSLASFVFALVGIPLAIWVRPSGKSFGIVIALVLMLGYYVLMQTGLTLIMRNDALGFWVAIAPNLILLLLGGLLWRQALRS